MRLGKNRLDVKKVVKLVKFVKFSLQKFWIARMAKDLAKLAKKWIVLDS